MANTARVGKRHNLINIAIQRRIASASPSNFCKGVGNPGVVACRLPIRLARVGTRCVCASLKDGDGSRAAVERIANPTQPKS